MYNAQTIVDKIKALPRATPARLPLYCIDFGPEEGKTFYKSRAALIKAVENGFNSNWNRGGSRVFRNASSGTTVVA